MTRIICIKWDARKSECAFIREGAERRERTHKPRWQLVSKIARLLEHGNWKWSPMLLTWGWWAFIFGKED